MMIVEIGEIVFFTSSGDVLVRKDALDGSPEDLFKAVTLAFEYCQHPVLLEAGNGYGPMAQLRTISFEQLLQAIRDSDIRDAGQAAKKLHTAIRRSEFGRARSDLVLALLAAGTPYVCCAQSCDITTNLTIDHIIPLSRGGTDDLSNLRFMCLPHNIAKGDKSEA